MSEEEFFNRLLNKIAKEFGYDVASTLELMFMTREKKVEQLENIRKEAIKYIEKCGGMELVNDYSFPEKPIIDKEAKTNLLNIINKGDNK